MLTNKNTSVPVWAVDLEDFKSPSSCPFPVPNKELQRASVLLLVDMHLLLYCGVLVCFFASYLTLFYSWTVQLFPKGSANSVVLFYQGNS